MKIYTIADKEEAEKLIGRKVRVVETTCGPSHQGVIASLFHVFKDTFGVNIYGDGYCTFVKSFQLLEKTLDDIEVGDVIVNAGSSDKVIRALVGDIVAYSDVDNGIWGNFIYWFPLVGLKEEGFTLKDSQPEEKVEKSVAELEKELGMKEGSLRIKKD